MQVGSWGRLGGERERGVQRELPHWATGGLSLAVDYQAVKQRLEAAAAMTVKVGNCAAACERGRRCRCLLSVAWRSLPAKVNNE